MQIYMVFIQFVPIRFMTGYYLWQLCNCVPEKLRQRKCDQGCLLLIQVGITRNYFTAKKIFFTKTLAY